MLIGIIIIRFRIAGILNITRSSFPHPLSLAEYPVTKLIKTVLIRFIVKTVIKVILL